MSSDAASCIDIDDDVACVVIHDDSEGEGRSSKKMKRDVLEDARFILKARRMERALAWYWLMFREIRF